jgi:hypothetical protein
LNRFLIASGTLLLASLLVWSIVMTSGPVLAIVTRQSERLEEERLLYRQARQMLATLDRVYGPDGPDRVLPPNQVDPYRNATRIVEDTEHIHPEWKD